MRRTVLRAVLPLVLLLAGCGLFSGPEHFVVYFGAGSNTLDAQGQQVIATVAEKARARPGTPVVVSGFATPEGTVAANLMLADSRAATVASGLIKAGVDAARIQRRAIGGVDFALDSIESRRVEITLGGM
jgi:outer membrane protein OmpA-like peptidoglycan-associated protein